MKFAAVILALAASAFSQSIADIPPCAITCLTTGIGSSGCAINDYACQCSVNRPAIEAAVMPCLQAQCNAEQQATVVAITETLCAANGGGSSAGTSATPSASASAPATQSSSAAAGRVGAAGALLAGAALLAL